MAVAPRKRRSGKRPLVPECPRDGAPSLPGGPAVFVAVIGDPVGRWSPSYGKVAPVLQRAWQSGGVITAGPWPDSPMVLGFAVVEAWRFIMALDNPTVQALFIACRSAESGERREVVGGLSHHFLAACALAEPLQVPCRAADVATMDGAALGEKVRRAAAGASVKLFDSCGASATASLSDVLARWAASGVIAEADLLRCFAWPLWSPVATAIVERKWTLDVTVLVQRATKRRWAAPVQPPALLVQQYKRWLVRSGGIPAPADPVGAPNAVSKKRKHGRREVHEFRLQVACLKVSQFVMAQRHVPAAVAASAELMGAVGAAQQDTGTVGAACGPGPGSALSVPLSWSTILRARTRLDVCAMLAQRRSGAANDYRYLFFDASPQRSGREVFCCVERLVPRGILLRASSGGPRGPGGYLAAMSGSAVDRRLPVCGLGEGRTAFADKVVCLLHQLWLEYGPASSGIRRACRSVRSCLSDMGTEFGICDFADIVDDVVAQGLVGIPSLDSAAAPAVRAAASATARSGSGSAFLFPFALKVPGIRHIVDWVLQRAVERCPWWSPSQAQCKQGMQ